MRPNPKAIGERSEGVVLAALLRLGLPVLQPFGDNQRYDLVVDTGTRFVRVQCKTARVYEPGTLIFDTCSSQCHRGRGKHSYIGQIEVFAVYSPDTDKVYIVPVSDVGRTAAMLRLEPPRRITRGQKIRMARDYELRAETFADTSNHLVPALKYDAPYQEAVRGRAGNEPRCRGEVQGHT